MVQKFIFSKGHGGGERNIFGPFYISIFGTILDYVYFTSVLYGCLVLEKVTNILLAFFVTAACFQ